MTDFFPPWPGLNRIVFLALRSALLNGAQEIVDVFLIARYYLEIEMHIAVIGSGYVRLVTGACFAAQDAHNRYITAPS